MHQAPFQVTDVNGTPQLRDGLRDIVAVPIRGAVAVVIPFTNPDDRRALSISLHILSHEDRGHEDRGMMATIEVVAPR
jgi:FtsP/CotA-like multicopper oxidase with cupredoxin domain